MVSRAMAPAATNPAIKRLDVITSVISLFKPVNVCVIRLTDTSSNEDNLLLLTSENSALVLL